MAEVLFATTEAKAKVERVSRARTTSVTNWTSWLPFRSLSGWTPKYLNGDLVAGFTLAAIAIPEQMATARLGGFAPEIGFFVFVAGSLAFAVFGASRYLSAARIRRLRRCSRVVSPCLPPSARPSIWRLPQHWR